MQIYQLSEPGRNVTYAAWRKMGGCGLPNNTHAPGQLGPIAHWKTEVTLGQIEDVCPYTGRCLAYFAVEHLNRLDMAVPYRSPYSK